MIRSGSMRIIIIFFLLLTLTSCWETLPDGRKYMLNKNCVKSHEETYTTLAYNVVLDIPELVTETKVVCDSIYYDTIWKNGTRR